MLNMEDVVASGRVPAQFIFPASLIKLLCNREQPSSGTSFCRAFKAAHRIVPSLALVGLGVPVANHNHEDKPSRFLDLGFRSIAQCASQVVEHARIMMV